MSDSTILSQIQAALSQGNTALAMQLTSQLQAQHAMRGAGGPQPAQDIFGAHETLWVRLKPYDPKRGILRRRACVPEITRQTTVREARLDATTNQVMTILVDKNMPRVMVGGSGAPGDVPVWVEVLRDTAIAVTKYRQAQDNPHSPQLFDVVTFEQKQQIDAAEQKYRLTTLGMGAPHDTAKMYNVTADSVGMAQTRAQAQGPAMVHPPTLAAGAEQYAQAAGAAAPAVPIGGRAAALVPPVTPNNMMPPPLPPPLPSVAPQAQAPMPVPQAPRAPAQKGQGIADLSAYAEGFSVDDDIEAAERSGAGVAGAGATGFGVG